MQGLAAAAVAACRQDQVKGRNGYEFTRLRHPRVSARRTCPYRPGRFKRLYDKITGKEAVKHPWYTLPKDLGLAELIGIRDTLRRENLVDTSRLPSVNPCQPPPYDESYLTARTADGSWNDLEHPEMGMGSTRFGRNVPLDDTWPDQDRMMVPNPREISLKLMTRDTFNPATGRQRADHRVAAVHAARLGQARHQPQGQPVGPAGGRGRRLAHASCDRHARTARPDHSRRTRRCRRPTST